MEQPVYSPDGKFMWTVAGWIPAPVVSANSIHLKSSLIGGKTGTLPWSTSSSCITGFDLDKQALYALFNGIPTIIMKFDLVWMMHYTQLQGY